MVPLGLITVPFIENVINSKPVPSTTSSLTFILGFFSAVWLFGHVYRLIKLFL
jgi:hypothetical protein